MAELLIYRDRIYPALVATVQIDENTVFKKRLMGDWRILCETISATALDIKIGDFITYNDEEYYINRQPDIDKVNSSTYKYIIAFESIIFDLSKKLFMNSDGLSDFTMTDTASGFIDLILSNLVWGWSAVFSNDSCGAALARIAETFGMEFDLNDREIILNKSIGVITQYRFRYGRDQGLYKIVRQQASDQNVVTKVYGFGGTTNIPYTYRSGAKRLVFEERFLVKNDDVYGVIEGQFTDNEIYPKRTGTLTGVNAVFGTAGYDPINSYVVDSSINFDLNTYFIPKDAQKPKIVFKSGDLSGTEFDITSYNHTLKRIYFDAFTDAGGYTTPRDLGGGSFIRPEVGDTYTFINISMPTEYITTAETALKAATQAYLDENSVPQYLYSIDIDPKYAKRIVLDLHVGDRVTIIDSTIGINTLIRVSGIEFPLVNIYKIKILISDFAPYSFQERIVRSAIADKQEIIKVEERSIERDRLRALKTIQQVSGNYLLKTGDTGVGDYDFNDSTFRIKGNAPSVITGSINPAASTSVTGTGTLFLSELVPGDRIVVAGETRTIVSITSDTLLIVDSAFSGGNIDPAPIRLPAIFILKDHDDTIRGLIRDTGDVLFTETLSAGLPNITTDYQVYFNPVTKLLSYGPTQTPVPTKRGKGALYNWATIKSSVLNRPDTVFFVTEQKKIYAYNPDSGLLTYLASHINTATDIANSDTKLWINDTDIGHILEYDITYNPLTIIFNRSISCYLVPSPGLTSRDNTELMGMNVSTLYSYNIITDSAVMTELFYLGDYTSCTGDIMYNAITDTYIIAWSYNELAHPELNAFHITEFANDGTLIKDIDITSYCSDRLVFGLFQYNNKLYAAASNGASPTSYIYEITSTGLTLISTINGINIYGASQNPPIITVNLPLV
jgi:hypothetical protein